MLKKLLAKKRLDEKRTQLKVLESEIQKVEERKVSLAKRSEDAAQAIEEITEDSTDEEKQVVEDEVDEIEAESDNIIAELAVLENQKTELMEKIKELEGELEEDPEPIVEEVAERSVAQGETKPIVRGEKMNMEIRKGFFKGWDRSEAQAFVERASVKEMLTNVRTQAQQKRAITGADILIPDEVVLLLRDAVHKYSKLMDKVWVRPLSGNARVNVVGEIPEGVWTEACATLNELDLRFYQYEMDGYKVGGYIAICNATLEDSDLNLANEILNSIGQAIGFALDKAILYGTGRKMPLGIVTRLAQSTQPETWGAKAPTWVNLSTSNIAQVTGATAEELFSDLILKAGAASKAYGESGKFWAMNDKTYQTLMSKMVTFNASGAVVASIDKTMPILSGDIVELPFMADGDIVGGYGGQYILVERAGMKLASSEHAQFIEDNTVFKGTARYDGTPLQGNGFVALNISGQAPATTVEFAPDEANTTEPVEGV